MSAAGPNTFRRVGRASLPRRSIAGSIPGAREAPTVPRAGDSNGRGPAPVRRRLGRRVHSSRTLSFPQLSLFGLEGSDEARVPRNLVGDQCNRENTRSSLSPPLVDANSLNFGL